MNKDLKYAIRDGQDLGRACYIFACGFLNEGNIASAKYWQERARQHYARCRSMAGIEQEDYAHG